MESRGFAPPPHDGHAFSVSTTFYLCDKLSTDVSTNLSGAMRWISSGREKSARPFSTTRGTRRARHWWPQDPDSSAKGAMALIQTAKGGGRNIGLESGTGPPGTRPEGDNEDRLGCRDRWRPPEIW
jgi:hypothetical protein